jgi:hypothetical protein
MWSFSQISGFTRIGESWINIGEPRNAIRSLERALELGRVKDSPRFVAHARLVSAAAYVKLNQPELACTIASEVFASFPQDFYTIERRARDLFDAFDSRKQSAEVASLREEFRYYVETSGARFAVDSGPYGGDAD